MKPLKLIMNAFGTYAAEQIIDFTLLGTKTFFLIHGPTGAGKTTILDAISFALYGTASGDLRETKALRSDFASPAEKTSVTFAFQSGAKAYEVTRSPEQEVAKQRGEGTRKLPANAVLVDITTEERQPVASGAGEVTTQIEEIIGFKAEQFRQIVLLPQGEFRRFLIAESKDRKTILETLFKTGIYRLLENKLAEYSRSLETAYNDRKKERAYLLETAACENKTDLEAKVAAYQTSQSQLLAATGLAAQQWQQAQDTLAAAKVLHTAFEEAAAAQAALGLLEAEAPQRSAEQECLAQAEQAALVEPSYNNCGRAYQKQQAAEQDCLRLKKAFDAAAALLQELQHKLQQLAPMSGGCATKEEPAAASVCADFSANNEALQGLLTEAIITKEKLTAASKTQAKLLRAQALFTQFEAAERQGEAALDLAAKKQEALTAELSTLRHLAAQNLAAQLAAELKPDQPCPVCGATHHPQPATATNTTEQDVTAAEKALAVSQTAFVTASSNLATAKSQAASQRSLCHELTEELGDYGRLDALELAQQLKACTEQVKTMQELQKTYQASQLALSTAQADYTNAQQNYLQATGDFTATRTTYQEQLAASGFCDQKKGEETISAQNVFLAARKTSTERVALRQQLTNYHQQVAAAAQRLQRAHKAIENQAPPQLAELLQQEQLARTALQELQKQTAVLERDLAQAQAWLATLTKLETRLQKLEDEYKNASSLALTARGDNASRLSFSGFVLQTLLDDVLQAANARLVQMSRGRFCLSRTQEITDARRENGLNIEVMDSNTGVARPVKTLSGGEIFLASLSLALGLSDVVQAYAGGIRLDTILVDEGFGSLDSESLDLAIRTLTDLQKGGRLVGIISHVGELRERIATRLEITPGQRGSSAKFYV